jgi:UDP-N-acetylmuramate dehydrogenase
LDTPNHAELSQGVPTGFAMGVIDARTHDAIPMSLRIVSPFSGLEGAVTENAPLRSLTWFKVGGPARYLIQPRSIDEAREAAVRCVEHNIPIYVLGRGANLLIRDEGVPGAVFKLDTPAFTATSIDLKTGSVNVGAGVDLAKLILRTCRDGLSGLETLAGIPATVGGAIRMNAGGRFGDIGQVVGRVTVMDSQGHVFDRTRDDLVFEYRRTNIVAPFILGATLGLDVDDPEAVTKRYKEIWMYKQNSQPLNARSAGCMFRNPTGPLSAGAMIDQAGLKGFRIGQAEVSDRHANFIVAHEGCTSADLLMLMKRVQERVADKFSVVLHPEVQVWPEPMTR